MTKERAASCDGGVAGQSDTLHRLADACGCTSHNQSIKKMQNETEDANERGKEVFAYPHFRRGTTKNSGQWSSLRTLPNRPANPACTHDNEEARRNKIPPSFHPPYLGKSKAAESETTAKYTTNSIRKIYTEPKKDTMPSTNVSILNEALGPVMRGPSSSHTAASVRIGLLARGLCSGAADDFVVDYDPRGSLASCADTQGVNIGLVAGFLGYESSDERLPRSIALLRSEGKTFTVNEARLDYSNHPNTYRITMRCRATGESHWMVALSTGGGAIKVISVDGVDYESKGGRCYKLLYVAAADAEAILAELQAAAAHHKWIGVQKLTGAVQYTPEGPVEDGVCLIRVYADHHIPDADLPAALEGRFASAVLSKATMPIVLAVPLPAVMDLPFTTVAQMQAYVQSHPKKDGTAWQLHELALVYERARSGYSAEHILGSARKLVDIYEAGVAAGLAGTTYEDRMLGPQSLQYAANMRKPGTLLDLGLNNTIVAYVTAFMEVKSSFGLIIGAPTAGSCGTIPGCLIAAMHSLGKSYEEVTHALLGGGLIGMFIATRSTFAAEEGGCQAECGAAGSMAAAALTYLMGGTVQQCVASASMVLQSVLGMACDPIAARVEAPCLLRNVLAATMAASCTNMVLSDFSAVIPYDEVLAAHWDICVHMPRGIRCTGTGGLGAQPTAKALEAKLSAAASGGCSGCSGCGGVPDAVLEMNGIAPHAKRAPNGNGQCNGNGTNERVNGHTNGHSNGLVNGNGKGNGNDTNGHAHACVTKGCSAVMPKAESVW